MCIRMLISKIHIFKNYWGRGAGDREEEKLFHILAHSPNVPNRAKIGSWEPNPGLSLGWQGPIGIYINKKAVTYIETEGYTEVKNKELLIANHDMHTGCQTMRYGWSAQAIRQCFH